MSGHQGRCEGERSQGELEGERSDRRFKRVPSGLRFFKSFTSSQGNAGRGTPGDLPDLLTSNETVDQKRDSLTKYCIIFY